MRKQFVECKYSYQAKKQCPWWSIVTKCVDGYMVFESIDDFNVWKNTK